jgi:hypothetical protein
LKPTIRIFFALGVIVALLAFAGCTVRDTASNSEPPTSQTETAPPATEPETEPPTATEPPTEPEPTLTEDRANEIMCIFGAEPEVLYDDKGQIIPSDVVTYQTEVISFYYDEDGIASADEIDPYGFYGWYMAYTLLQQEKIAGIIPDFQRFAPVGDESAGLYGAPADNYERIVTSFFDVDVERLRGEDLYNEEFHAYVPMTGPGIGERPSIRVTDMMQEADLITLEIMLEREFEGSSAFTLTVRENPANEFAGIAFVSLKPLIP